MKQPGNNNRNNYRKNKNAKKKKRTEQITNKEKKTSAPNTCMGMTLIQRKKSISKKYDNLSTF